MKNNLALICREWCQKLPLLNSKINGNAGSVCWLPFNSFSQHKLPTPHLSPAVFVSDQIFSPTIVWIFWISPWVSCVFLAESCHNPDTSPCNRPSPPSRWGRSSCRGAGICWQASPPSAGCWRLRHCNRMRSYHHRHLYYLFFGRGFASHIP